MSIFGLFIAQSPIQVHAASLDCSTASNINVPVIECEALLDLYDSTNGGGWYDNTNWDTDTNVCFWYGIGCDNIAGQDRVVSIDLQGNNLNGTLVGSLSALDQMNSFNAYQNQLVGSLPVEWDTWTGIQNFGVYQNQLIGTLPVEWDTWSNIGYFDVYQNQLIGTLPVEWDTWSSIDVFNAGRNQLTGALPIEWDTRTNIHSFNVGENQLIGTLPIEWDTWTGMLYFNVQVNQLTGTLPTEWDTWTGIGHFYAGENQLTGTLPIEWDTWTNIYSFNVGVNQLIGILPVEWDTWANIHSFDARVNQFTGILPVEWSSWTDIYSFDVWKNELVGILPVEWSSWTDIYEFHVGVNQLTGMLPIEWDTWTNIGYFDAYENQFIGTLPVEWDSWINIYSFDVNQNQLSGILPVEWDTWTNIYSFDVSQNQLTGPLPTEWDTWTNIYSFYAGLNQITGILPMEWGTWTNIRIVDIQQSQLSGPLPTAWSAWTNIQTFRLQQNQLTGPLPTAWDTWTNIYNFSVQDNQLTGPIPASWATNFLNLSQGNFERNCLDVDGYDQTTQLWIDNYASLIPQNNCSIVDLSIDKTTQTIQAASGDTIIYTLTYYNNGPDTATDVVIYDMPTTGLSIIDASVAYTTNVAELAYGTPGDICRIDLSDNNTGPYADAINQWALDGGSGVPGATNAQDVLYFFLQESVDLEEITEQDRDDIIASWGWFFVEYVAADGLEAWFGDIELDISTIDPSCGELLVAKAYGIPGDVCFDQLANNTSGPYALALDNIASNVEEGTSFEYFLNQQNLYSGGPNRGQRWIHNIDGLLEQRSFEANMAAFNVNLSNIDPSCGIPLPPITFTLEDLPSGSEGSFTVTMAVDGSLLQSGDLLTNTVSIESSANDTSKSDNESMATVTYTEALADLAVSKRILPNGTGDGWYGWRATGEGTQDEIGHGGNFPGWGGGNFPGGVQNIQVTSGATVTYIITYGNNGPDVATGVFIYDIPMAGLSIIDASVPYTNTILSGVDALQFVIDDLPAGSTGFFTVTMLVGGSFLESGDLLPNTALITSTTQDDDEQYNESTVTVTYVEEELGPIADLSINKTTQTVQSISGDTITYTIIYQNNGPDIATGVVIYDMPMTGLSITGASIPYTEIQTVYGVVGDSCFDQLVNDTSGPYVDALNQWALNEGYVSFEDFLGRRYSGGPNRGQRLVYNIDNKNFEQIAFQENMMTAFGIDIASFGTSCGIVGAIPISIGDLPAGSTGSFTVTMLVEEGFVRSGSLLTNIASITSLTQDDDYSDNESIASTIYTEDNGWSRVLLSDLSIHKTAQIMTVSDVNDYGQVISGNTVTYTIAYQNNGPDPAPDVVIYDIPSTGLSIINASREYTNTVISGVNVLQFMIGDLPVGSGGSFTVMMLVDGSFLESEDRLINIASIISSTQNNNESDNTSIAIVTYFDEETIGTPSGTGTKPTGPGGGGLYTPPSGTTPLTMTGTHNAPELVGKACIYNDEQYLTRGPFDDILGHRGYPYIEIMRVSCLHRGRHTTKGYWRYDPEGQITRAEVLKTLVKIMGVAYDDFTIETEDNLYVGSIPFADVPNKHRFSHYINYAYEKGLLQGLISELGGNKYISPDISMTRYEAIRVMMSAYNAINQEDVDIQGRSTLGDVIDTSNPYYKYIRQAEMLGFITGVPQSNGGYNFEGQRYITRAEFAKIIGAPFGEQLFEIQDVIKQSDIYQIIATGLYGAKGNKGALLLELIQSLSKLDDTTFLNKYKIKKSLFLQGLEELISEEFTTQ